MQSNSDSEDESRYFDTNNNEEIMSTEDGYYDFVADENHGPDHELQEFLNIHQSGSPGTSPDEADSQRGSLVSSLSSSTSKEIMTIDLSRSLSNSPDHSDSDLDNQSPPSQYNNKGPLKPQFTRGSVGSNAADLEFKTSRFSQIFGIDRKFESSQQREEAAESGYAKITCVNKNSRDIVFQNHTRLRQSFHCHDGPIWAMKFSPDGRYLCTAGQDTRVMVWIFDGIEKEIAPLSPIESSFTSSSKSFDSSYDSGSEDGRAPSPSPTSDGDDIGSNSGDQILCTEPFRVFEGHTSDVVDVAWSRSNFLLSASIDKTVCLWHVSRYERLQTFGHPDIVTSVEFHPVHDRYFISGCFDKRIRVWDIIADGSVKHWGQTPDKVTAVAFRTDGETVVSGLINGQVLFYTFKMRSITQLECRNRRGKYKSGSKVTGFSIRRNEEGISDERSGVNTGRLASVNESMLVSTNDHRIRMYKLDDYSLQCKFKGHRNRLMQIRASFSEDGNYTICGSENGAIYIWNTHYIRPRSLLPSFMVPSNRNASYERIDVDFSGNNLHVNSNGNNVQPAITVASFAPLSSIPHLIHHHENHLAHDHQRDIMILDSLVGRYKPWLPRFFNSSDFSSRVVAAADDMGVIRIYIREF